MPAMRRTGPALLVALLFAVRLSAQSIDDRVESLLEQMTLEEKVGQLIQYTVSEKNLEKDVAAGEGGAVFDMHKTAAENNALQRIAVEKSRLHIPLLFGHDIIHGCRTIFPIPIGIASSWDPAAAELAARIAAREASALGIRWTFAPMVDIARDPRWGRIAEGAGEDPFLGSAMSAAYVRGFQGKDIGAPDSILACAKHYAAYGAAEGGRDYNTVDMSERTLREVYLPPFKAAVDAGTWTLMSAFDSLNGVPASANRHLLTEILRDEWKFKGFVDSDFDAVVQLISHGIARDPEQAATKAITAGVDMNMVDASYLKLVDAVKGGRLPESVVDTAVRRVLRAKFALGLFEHPYTDETRAKREVLTKENRDAARRIAGESIILLKNDGGLLPLPKAGKAIAIIGPLAASQADLIGPWGGFGRDDEVVSLLTGIAGKGVHVEYARGCGISDGSAQEIAVAVETARKADVVVLALGEAGRMSGEAESRAFLDLPGMQEQLLEAIVATGKPVVLVVMAGRPLTISWAAAHVPAIVWPWFAGTEGGNAIADVLFGDVNPGGKLPVTIPRTVGQVPIYYAHLPTGRPPNPEDKFTSKYIDLASDPLYPFGFGLSYTKFEYSDLRIAPGEGNTFTVSAKVKNSGSRAGDEVVQLYIHDPVASVSRPVKELKGFRRVTLAAGETRTVEFTLRPQDLSFWSDKGWTLEPGEFEVWVGPSSVEGVQETFQVK